MAHLTVSTIGCKNGNVKLNHSETGECLLFDYIEQVDAMIEASGIGFEKRNVKSGAGPGKMREITVYRLDQPHTLKRISDLSMVNAAAAKKGGRR